MKWSVIERKPKGPRKTEPYASVGRNAINLSSGAVALIPNYKDYMFAEILQAEEGINRYVGIRLLKEATANSIPIRRKKVEGKEINGMTISDGYALARAFGRAISEKKGVTRFPVTRDLNDNILMIKLSQADKKAAEQGKFDMERLF